MPREVTSTRLERILLLLPLAAREEGVTLEHLARALECTRHDVVRDLEEIAAREYYHPAGSGDAVQIGLDGERVRIWTTGQFRRPVRLLPREALALGLGLRVLAAEAPAEERHRLLEAAAALEVQLAVPPAAARVIAFEAEARGDELLPVVAGAIRERRRVVLRYVKPGAAGPEPRDVAPYRLVHGGGAWYVLAADRARDGVRTFRLDRVVSAIVSDEGFDVPADFDARDFLTRDGRLFRDEGGQEAWVRYSPRIARWIVERTGIRAGEDGSVTIRHQVADPRWLVRHVLQYGADAEVLAPPALRQRTREAAQALARE
jgi:proteasome accessory factor C